MKCTKRNENRGNTTRQRSEIKKKKLYSLSSSNNTEENEDVKKRRRKVLLACRFTFSRTHFPQDFQANTMCSCVQIKSSILPSLLKAYYVSSQLLMVAIVVFFSSSSVSSHYLIFLLNHLKFNIKNISSRI